MSRKWSRAAQVALEKPQRPRLPAACPQCGCRWYFEDEDGDWVCLMCGRTLVLWSRYRFELRRWKEGLAARAEADEAWQTRGWQGRHSRRDDDAA